MKKKQKSLVVEAVQRIGAEAWLAVRARPGGGVHKDRRTPSRAVQRRRAVEDES